LRLSGIFPVARMLDTFASVQAERADSLAFRFRHEDALLARARERVLFGWGQYDRNLIHNDQGRVVSVTDGHWIICVGVNGLAGFITNFAPLLIPVFLTRRHLALLADERSKLVMAGLAFTLTILTVDLIPNGLYDSYPFLIAGALTRRSREAKAELGERESIVAVR
jgi:hypothetical protein